MTRMNYIHAVGLALKAAQIRTEYYNQIPNPRYLQEAQDWIQVAHIYMEQMRQSF